MRGAKDAPLLFARGAIASGIEVKVRIFGAGVSGLACALAMRRRAGFDDVRVLEANTAEEARRRAGHGLLIMQNGVTALRALGAAGLLIGFQALRRTEIRDPAGALVEAEELDGVYCVTRAGLVAGLRAELPPDAIEYGRRVRSVDLHPPLPPGGDPRRLRRHARRIELEDGSSLTDADADLFIGADGHRSPLHAAFNPATARQHSQVFEIVTSTHEPSLAARLGTTFVKTTFPDRGLAFGLLAPTPQRVIGFLQFDTRRHGWPRATSGPGLRDFVVERMAEAHELITDYLEVADFQTAHLWRPVDADIAPGLCGTNAVLVGDAAHPLLPFTSQGVGAALEDAVMLADAVRAIDGDLTHLPRALAGFATDRTRDLEGYVAGGRRILAHFVGEVDAFVAPYVGADRSHLDEHMAAPATGLAELFALLDTDGDGRLTRQQLRQLAEALTAHSLDAASLDQLLDEMDGDRDGFVSRLELLDALAGGGDASPGLWAIRRSLTPRLVGTFVQRRTADVQRFDDDMVDLPLLRERAYNHRWAVHDPDVIPLTAADSDFPVCPEIVEALQRHLASGYLPYGPNEGLPELRRAAAEHLRARDGVACEPDTILATDGAASAVFLVAKHAIARPGDEAIIPDPVDFLLDRSVSAQGGVVRRWSWRDGRVDVDALEALITPRTRLLSLCNPHNPLGRVLRRDELEAIAEVALRHDLLILSDEVWSAIVYPPHRHVAVAAVDPEVAARTFTVHGFSKAYGLAGLRLGYVVAPSRSACNELVALAHADDTVFGASTLSQVAGVAAYERAGTWLSHFLRHLERQRDHAVARLNAIDGVRCATPEGTFVVFPDVSSLPIDQDDLSTRLLNDHRLAVVPGSPAFFGPGAAGHVRISLATSRAILDEGLNRFERGIWAVNASR